MEECDLIPIILDIVMSFFPKGGEIKSIDGPTFSLLYLVKWFISPKEEAAIQRTWSGGRISTDELNKSTIFPVLRSTITTSLADQDYGMILN